MRVISLGSGSSGNAVVVQCGTAAVLVDAGFAQRTLVNRLRQASIKPESITAILLTHEHHDHACGAVRFARTFGIPIAGDPRTLAAVVDQAARTDDRAQQVQRHELPVGRSATIGTLEVQSFPNSHDAVAPCGYLVGTSAWRACVITDTGLVTAPGLDALRRAQLLILEANHDRMRLLDGPYPHHLKQRILSPRGHLSNEQAWQALQQILDGGPRWLWLAHLSKTNNTPDLARSFITEQLRAAGHGHIVPVPLPRDLGPLWDSTALWADQTSFVNLMPRPAAVTATPRATGTADA